MNNKARAEAMAQREANRSGNTQLLVNLNPHGALWVVRDFDVNLARESGVVIVSPHVER